MSESSTNPFVLPGMGQASDLSGNPLLASMEMMRQAWAGLAGPGGLAQSLPMTPPLNTEELERRIADLRAVEGWLRMNLSMLGSTIQGLEVQRATIATLRSFVDSVSSADSSAAAAPGGPSPLEVALGLKPAPGHGAGSEPAAGDTVAGGQNQPDAQAGAEAAADLNNAARSASQAWWDMLQQQFTNIAAATAASMGAANAAAGAAPAAPASGPTAGANASRQGKPAAASGKAAVREPAARPARKRAAPRKTAVRRTPPGSSS